MNNFEIGDVLVVDTYRFKVGYNGVRFVVADIVDDGIMICSDKTCPGFFEKVPKYVCKDYFHDFHKCIRPKCPKYLKNYEL